MGVLYLAALIVGLGILSMGLFSGHGGDGDLGAGHADVDTGHDGAHHDDAGHALAIFLSLRFWSFGLLAFGLVGSALYWFGLAGPTATAVIAAIVGVFCGLLASLTLRALSRSVLSSGGDTNEALGQIGRVLLPIEPGQVGKIRLEMGGRVVDMLATTEGERLETGASVIVDRLRGGTAQVSSVPKALRSPEDP
jgi:membrane protein implicated in regulation of membrane protease activity